MNCDTRKVLALLSFYTGMLKVNGVKPKCLPWHGLCWSDTVILGGFVIPEQGLVLRRLDGAQSMLCATVLKEFLPGPMYIIPVNF